MPLRRRGVSGACRNAGRNECKDRRRRPSGNRGRLVTKTDQRMTATLKASTRMWLLNQLREGPMTAWDWDADLQLAVTLGLRASAKECGRVIASHAPFALSISYFNADPDICFVHRLRISGLRELQRDGVVYGFWCGTGPGGKLEFGVGRIRGYAMRVAGTEGVHENPPRRARRARRKDR